MTTERIRAYERRLSELARDAGYTGAQRAALLEHLREVAQLRMLSEPAALERDAAKVREWLGEEWQRLEALMNERWPILERELRAALGKGDMVPA